MWKMLPHGSSNDQVFIENCPKYSFFTVNFRVFGKNTFFILGRLRPVWEGFCVGLDPLGHPQIFFENQDLALADL